MQEHASFRANLIEASRDKTFGHIILKLHATAKDIPVEYRGTLDVELMAFLNKVWTIGYDHASSLQTMYIILHIASKSTPMLKQVVSNVLADVVVKLSQFVLKKTTKPLMNVSMYTFTVLCILVLVNYTAQNGDKVWIEVTQMVTQIFNILCRRMIGDKDFTVSFREFVQNTLSPEEATTILDGIQSFPIPGILTNIIQNLNESATVAQQRSIDAVEVASSGLQYLFTESQKAYPLKEFEPSLNSIIGTAQNIGNSKLVRTLYDKVQNPSNPVAMIAFCYTLIAFIVLLPRKSGEEQPQERQLKALKALLESCYDEDRPPTNHEMDIQVRSV